MKNTLITIFCFITTISLAQSDLSAPIPFDPSIRTGKLANGLTYFIKKNAKPEKRAELRLALNVGATMENDDQRGLAHFCEHLCFNGTKNFKKAALVDYLESIGTKFGAHLNAYTSFDETVYQLQLPTDKADIFEKGFLVLEDWAHNVSFENEEIDKERGVVISERRNGLGAFERVNEVTFPLLMNQSRYAERLPIGKLDVLEKSSYATIKQFYKDWYRPNLMAVIAVGDFDVDVVERYIKSHFEGIQNPQNQRALQVFNVNDHNDIKSVVATDKEMPYNIAEISIKHPVGETKTIKDFRSDLIGELVNSMLGNRLSEIQSMPNSPFSYAGASFSQLVRTKNHFNMYCITADNGVAKGMESLLTEAERARRFGFVAGELARAKKEMLKQIENNYNERDKIPSANHVQGLVYYFLENNRIITVGAEKNYALYNEFIPNITLEEVNAMIQKWLDTNGKNVVLTGIGTAKPENLMPSEKDLISMYNSLKDKKLEAYTYTEITKPLLDKMPEEGKVSALKDLPVLQPSVYDKDGLTGMEYTFENGARVVLIPTKFKNDEVLFNAYSWGGSSNYGENDIQNINFFSSIIEESGIGNFSKTDLQKFLTGKNVDMSIMLGELSENMNGKCSQDDFETLLQLIYAYVTSPRKDKEAFETFKTQQKSWLQNKDTNPESVFYEQSNYALYNKNIRDKPLSVSDLDKINLDRVFEIYNERFHDGADFTYFFVGNFEKQNNILSLLQKYIGSLPNDPKGDYWKDIDHDLVKGNLNYELKMGQSPKANVQLTFNTPFDYNRKNKAVEQALIKLLQIKLREAIREDKSGSYGVGVYGGVTHYPQPESTITIEFGCDPSRQAELTKIALEVIEKIKKEGCDEKNLTKIKETRRRELETNFKENGFWLSTTSQSYQNNEDIKDCDSIEKLFAYTNELKGEEFKAFAKKLLDKKTLKTCILKPEIVKP